MKYQKKKKEKTTNYLERESHENTQNQKNNNPENENAKVAEAIEKKEDNFENLINFIESSQVGLVKEKFSNKSGSLQIQSKEKEYAKKPKSLAENKIKGNSISNL